MLLVILFAVLLGGEIIDNEAARILAVYPGQSISHQVVFRPITLELIKRGHKVTVLTTDPIFQKGDAPENLTEIDMHDISYAISNKHFVSVITGSEADLINQVKITVEIVQKTFEEQMKIRNVRDVIFNKTGKFDLILLEAFYAPALGISHIFKAPTVLVSSFGPFLGNYEMMGAPTHPLLYHNIFRQRLYNLNIWEKMSELYNQLHVQNIFSSCEENYNKLLKRIFGPDTPPLSVLKNNVDLLLLNIHPIWEGNYPVPPNVIYMGGLHQKPRKKLPEDLQHYLDASPNGVIYFSFGTNVKPSTLPAERIEIFEKVFSRLPFNVIWKWDTEHFPVKSKNIKVFQWLPQSDLLRHHNIKLFITQGGLQSTDEAITAGVPLIGIPMLGDQWYNVEKYVYHGIGVRLDLENLTEDRLRNAITEVIEDKRYSNNIARLRTLMQDQPQSPLNRSIWWIEYVLRHGGAKHLRAPAANISWTEYLELELVGVILFSAIVIVGIIVVVIRFLVTHILRNFVKSRKIKKN